jgi:Na+-translocating ferredoxin:NAD+ oxidoreductase RnfG subunit
MKKAAILLMVIFTISSCSLFEKPSMTQEEIDALINQKAKVEEELVNLKQDYQLLKIKADECAKMFDQQAKKEAVSGKYHVIVGSFKKSTNAEKYSTKMKEAGASGDIIQGPSDFKLVVYTSHKTLKEAAESMYKARSSITDDAWIYMSK